MAIRFVVDRVCQRMLTHVDGIVTFHDLNHHLDEEVRQRGIDLPEIFDARGATVDITSDEIRRLVDRAGQIAKETPFGPTAIVVTDPAAYGMARMFSMRAESVGVDVAVFRDVGSATRWIEIAGGQGSSAG